MVKGRLSVIIPNRNSPFLTKTIEDLLQKAKGDIEILVNVDENWPERLVDDPRVTYKHPDKPMGLRWGVNTCAEVATGEFLMKTDDHCMFSEGFDVELKSKCDGNWVVIPRRYSLDAENWTINTSRPHRDYMYLCYPQKGKQHDDGMHGVEWWERQRERTGPEFDLDDTPSMQGSCWFMTKTHFKDFLGGMSEVGYGQFAQESQEIGNKTWLGGGRMIVNKKAWYAHLHKGKTYGRMYKFNHGENVRCINWSADYWMNNRWEGRIHDIAWLVEEKFPNMPTWPVDWRKWYG